MFDPLCISVLFPLFNSPALRDKLWQFLYISYTELHGVNTENHRETIDLY
jgi:hypothetical protein